MARVEDLAFRFSETRTRHINNVTGVMVVTQLHAVSVRGKLCDHRLVGGGGASNGLHM